MSKYVTGKRTIDYAKQTEKYQTCSLKKMHFDIGDIVFRFVLKGIIST